MLLPTMPWLHRLIVTAATERHTSRVIPAAWLVGYLFWTCGMLGAEEPGPAPTPIETAVPGTAPVSPAEFGIVVPTPGAEQLPPAPTLADCLRFATERNPAVQAARARWEAANAEIPQARALPDPIIFYETMTRQETPEHRFGAKQELPPFGALRAAGQKAQSEAQAEQYSYLAEQLRAAYRVKTAFHECLYLTQALEVQRATHNLVQELTRTLRDRYAAAAATHPDLLRLQSETARLETDLQSLEARRPVLAARLREALGLPPTGPQIWPAPISSTLPPPAVNEADLLAQLENDNPEVRAAREMVAAAEAGTSRARAMARPGFMLSAKQMRTEGGPAMGATNYPIEAMIEMSLPFNFAKNRARREQAEAKLTEARQRQDADLYRLTADLQEALFRYADSGRRATLFRDELIPRQEQTLAALRTAFAGGQAQFREVIEAERMLLELRLMNERARADQWIDLAEVEMLSGRELAAPAAQ